VPNEFSAATDITYFTEWRLYRPENSKKVIRFQVGDSIFWTATGISADEVYFKMPRIKEALVGGGIASGLKMAGYISPNWVNQSRYYFETGKREVDAGIPLIKDNRWEDAAAIWNKYATAYSGTIKSKIEFNLALAAEMNGDLYLAIEWALKSFKTKYTKAAEVYINALEKIRIAKQKSDKTRY